MSKAYGAITARLLELAVGKSCVVGVQRPDRYLKTVRKYAPERGWSVESVEGQKVITRTQ